MLRFRSILFTFIWILNLNNASESGKCHAFMYSLVVSLSLLRNNNQEFGMQSNYKEYFVGYWPTENFEH